MRLLKTNNVNISVIIPAYNAGSQLKKCLDSILNQSFMSFEIIAINDCSTDNTLNILNSYSNNYTCIKIINNLSNLGAGASRNLALDEAKGKFITFIDSDDWLGKNYLERLYTEAEKTNADIVFSNMIMVDKEKEYDFKEFSGLINKYRDSKGSLLDLPVDWRSTAPWMKLFKKKFIEKNSLKFQEDIRLGAEDIPFSWIAYFTANKISFCDDVFYYYNLTEDSLDRSVNENILEIFDALEFTEKKYNTLDPTKARKAQLDLLFVSHLAYQFTKITANNNQQPEDLAEIFWKKAHITFVKITPVNILDNKYSQRFSDFYIDVISHPELNDTMKIKYFKLDESNT